MSIKNLITASLLILNPAFCIENDNSFYGEHEKGWFWYEKGAKPEEEDEKEKKDKSDAEKYPYSAQLETFKKEMEEKTAKAVLTNDRQAILDLQLAQKRNVVDPADTFAKLWVYNMATNNELDPTADMPTNTEGRKETERLKREKMEKDIGKLSQRYALFFFFSSHCGYCKMFAPVVREFAEKYNFKVMALSTDGQIDEWIKDYFPDASADTENLGAFIGVKNYPSLFAVDLKEKKVLPAFTLGYTTIGVLEERVYSMINYGDE